MEYDKQIQHVHLQGLDWWKISGDQAFESILDGYSEYEKIWTQLVKEKEVVVQAGGYCGVFPRMLSYIFSTVYTFEPDPLNFYCLTRNCQSDNIIKAQSALSFCHGLVEVERRLSNNRGMNIVRPTENAKIPTYTIDDLALHRCDLIALDTEGFEYSILLGATKTIDEYKPVITVEDPTEKIDVFLDNRGYKLRHIVHNRDAIYSV